MKFKHTYWSVILSSLLLWSCSESSEKKNDVFLYTNNVDIEYGKDVCSYTNEVIKTVRYGGKITMDDGSTHKFMSVECLAGYYLKMDNKEAIQSIEMVDFAHGQKYLPADELVFLRSSLRPSPNGMSLTAIDNSNEKMKDYIYDAYPGEFMNWDEVLDLVSEEWALAR